VAAQRERVEPITYWVVVGGEQTEFGLPMKLSQLKYGITGKIPDGMLIRVSTIDRDTNHAYQIQDQFIADLTSSLPLAERDRVLGSM
jgi:EpsI family protein